MLALGLLAALGDISRFPDGDHATAYLGLEPKTRQSGSKCFHGRITKVENPQARWLLTQACQHVSRHPGPLGAFFRRLAKRKPRQVAIMALARKLVTVAFLMLKNNEPYRNTKPDRMAKQFSELRSKSLRGQPAKVTNTKPKEPNLRMTARRGSSAINDQVGLPAVTIPDQLPAGEHHMLINRMLMGVVKELHKTKLATPTKPPKKTKPTAQ